MLKVFLMKHFSLQEIRLVMAARNYIFFSSGIYNLNIIGIRAKEMNTNTFNDLMVLAYKTENGEWQLHYFDCTTDPGTYHLESPMNVNGTAIMCEGQWRNAYTLGLHKGYKALVQKEPITFWRDRNRNRLVDLIIGSKRTEVIGANIHRASGMFKSKVVDKWSAACQVLADPQDFDLLISTCDKAVRKYGYKNSFTYTLLNEADFDMLINPIT